MSPDDRPDYLDGNHLRSRLGHLGQHGLAECFDVRRRGVEEVEFRDGSVGHEFHDSLYGLRPGPRLVGDHNNAVDDIEYRLDGEEAADGGLCMADAAALAQVFKRVQADIEVCDVAHVLELRVDFRGRNAVPGQCRTAQGKCAGAHRGRLGIDQEYPLGREHLFGHLGVADRGRELAGEADADDAVVTFFEGLLKRLLEEARARRGRQREWVIGGAHPLPERVGVELAGRQEGLVAERDRQLDLPDTRFRDLRRSQVRSRIGNDRDGHRSSLTAASDGRGRPPSPTESVARMESLIDAGASPWSVPSRRAPSWARRFTSAMIPTASKAAVATMSPSMPFQVEASPPRSAPSTCPIPRKTEYRPMIALRSSSKPSLTSARRPSAAGVAPDMTKSATTPTPPSAMSRVVDVPPRWLIAKTSKVIATKAPTPNMIIVVRRKREYTRPQNSSPAPKTTARAAVPRPIDVSVMPRIRNWLGSFLLPVSSRGACRAHRPRIALIASHVGAKSKTLRLVAIRR